MAAGQAALAMTHHPRRFPAPWTIDEANNACFIVRDRNGQALSYVYFENEPRGERRPDCLRVTRLGGSRSTSPSCRDCSAPSQSRMHPLTHRMPT